MPSVTNQSTMITKDELLYLERQRAHRFRPLLWRSLITPNTSIPSTVDVIEVQAVLDQAEIKAISPHNQVFPLPSSSKSKIRYTVFEFGNAVRYITDDEERARANGMTSPALRGITANQRVAEELADRIAALGYTDLGMYGMLNQPDVTPIASGVTGDWNGSATAQQMLDDLQIAADGVVNQTQEQNTAKTLILPPLAFRMANRKVYNATLGITVLQQFKVQNPGVVVVPWVHAASAGTNGRIMAFDSADPDVMEMYFPRPLSPQNPVAIHGGSEISYKMKIGGVISLFPQAISYVDGCLS